jgi:hypothetical protein
MQKSSSSDSLTRNGSHGWFVLSVKVVGILLLGFSLPAACGLIVGFAVHLFSERHINDWLQANIAFAPSLVQLALGAYLLFGGKWIIRMCLRSSRNLCPRCGYDRGRVGAEPCPECGFWVERPMV